MKIRRRYIKRHTLLIYIHLNKINNIFDKKRCNAQCKLDRRRRLSLCDITGMFL